MLRPVAFAFLPERGLRDTAEAAKSKGSVDFGDFAAFYPFYERIFEFADKKEMELLWIYATADHATYVLTIPE